MIRRAAIGCVLLGISVFVPPLWPTPDAFETPKTVAWCLALLLFTVAGPGRAPFFRGGRDIGGLAAVALLGWMLIRSLATRPILDPIVLVGWMLPPALYLAGRALSASAARAVARTAFWIGCVQAALMALQRVGLDPLFGGTTAEMAYAPGRMIGTVGYHNQAVDLLAVCAALGMASGVGAAKILGGLALVAVPTAYRAGLAGIAVGAILFRFRFRRTKAKPADATVSRRRQRWGALILVLAAAALLAAFPDTRERLGEAVRRPLETPALRTRATMVRAACAMIRDRPVSGWGSGAYAFQYMERLADLLPDHPSHRDLGSVVYAREPHNDLLHLACEFGLVGLFLAVLWIAAVFPDLPAAGRFLVGYWLVVSLFGFPWHDAAAGPLFGLALGLLERRDGNVAVRAASWEFFPFAAAGAVGLAAAIAQLGADAGWWRARCWQGRALAREGGLLAIDGRFVEAEAALIASRRIERSPEQANNLGFVKMRLRKAAEAEAVYRDWCASGIEHGKALGCLAGALEAQGRWAEAGDTLLDRHMLWPRESSDADLFRTAVLLLRGNETGKARGLIDSFRNRNGDTTRWTAEWENLSGAVELRRGATAKARAHFLRALEMKPELESAHRNLRTLPLP